MKKITLSIVLALASQTSLHGMESKISERLDDQFRAAIKQADYGTVKQLLEANPNLQQHIREYYTYTSFAMIAAKDPAKQEKALDIAQLLQQYGARFHPKSEQELVQARTAKPAAKPVPSLMPTAKPAPVTSKPAPAAAPKPVEIPAPAKKPAPSAPISTGKEAPADFVTVKELGADSYQDLYNYLKSHSFNNFTPEQKEKTFSTYLAGTWHAGVSSPEELKLVRANVKLFLEKGFVATNHTMSGNIKNIMNGEFGPRASRGVRTYLTQAVASGNLAEVKRLVEAEHEDVNERDANYSTPLTLAITFELEDIAEYLLSHGADINQLHPGERTRLSRLLGRPL